MSAFTFSIGRPWLAQTAYALAGLCFVALGLWAVVDWSMTELYADQWRQYLPYIEQSFPANVFVADNGHRAVIPSLIRLIENAWLDGNQRLQSIMGGLFALAAVACLAWVVLKDRSVGIQRRWAVAALAAFAVFWLGNARMLLHGNESTQVYLIVLCMAASALLLSGERERPSSVFGAGALALAATFSFGSGIAVFPALMLVVVLQRRWRSLGVLAGALVVALVLYFLLPGGEGVRNSLHFQPMANLRVIATWLASMWHAMLMPLFDPQAGSSLPLGLAEWTRPIAHAYVSVIGPAEERPWPFTLVGAIGLIMLAVATLRAWLAPEQTSRTVLAALAIAWFALGVAALVALGRLDYFRAYPGQIFANRYVPWSCLFWWGVIAATIARKAPPDRSDDASLTWLGHGFIASILVAGLATSIGYGIWARIVQQGVRVDSTGFASGVVDAGRRLGETLPEEVIRGLPAIKAAALSEFAWPEAQRIGSRLADAGIEAGVAIKRIESAVVENRLGGTALRLDVLFRRNASIDMPARLLVVRDGIAIGILVHQKSDEGWRYAGYANAGPSMTALRIGQLAHGGTFTCWSNCSIDSVE